MANHKSATKRAVQNVKKRAQNRSYLSKVRTAVKKFKLASQTPGSAKDQLQALFAEAQILLQRAASKGMMHKNSSSRRVSRLAAMMKK